jgi:hypothetical protein
MRRDFERALRRKLLELNQEKLVQLGKGVDFEQYRYWIGYLKAFEDFWDIIVELKKREDEDDG